MTDKQIIIDGVDVSGCEYFDYSSIKPQLYSEYKAFSSCFPECAFYDHCNEHPNCYYKQLKRKEQECEQQKAKLELFKTSNQTTIDQLKAENEDLKKSVLQECPNCGEEYLNYKGAALHFENSDLKQTLAEIKEIAENCYDPTDKENDGFWTILQKINEVEDEKNM